MILEAAPSEGGLNGDTLGAGEDDSYMVEREKEYTTCRRGSQLPLVGFHW